MISMFLTLLYPLIFDPQYVPAGFTKASGPSITQTYIGIGGTTSSAPTTFTITTTGACPAGGALSIGISYSAPSGTFSVTDVSLNTYTAGSTNNIFSDYITTFSAPVTSTLTSGSIITISATTGTSDMSAAAICIHGASTIDVNGAGANTNNGATWTTASFTTTTAAESIIVWLTSSGGVDVGASSAGYSVLLDNPSSNQPLYAVAGAVNSIQTGVSLNGTWTGNTFSAQLVASFH